MPNVQNRCCPGWMLSIFLVTFLYGCGDNNSPPDGQVLDSSSTNSANSIQASNSASSVSLAQLQSGVTTLNQLDPAAPFTTNLPDGVNAVSVNSPPLINFSVKDSQGRSITGLQQENLRFAMAKLVPGLPSQFGISGTGEADEWVSYIYRSKTGSAVTDGVQATFENGSDGVLSYNEQDEYYSYTFATDITTATRPDATTLIWDPAATHRLAIQFDITGNNGERILYNPHFDFSFENGVSVPLSDPSKSHRVADESVCNGCHNQLVAHGARVETEYCVMCHNPGSIDVEFGSDIDFKVMIHKIHKGRSLQNPYQIAGFGGVIHEWSDVGYPQDLRNCARCHDGENPLTPQGNNWNLKPTQQACGACHEDTDFNSHQGMDLVADDGSRDNSACRGCHGGSATNSSVINVHWNQADENAANYQFNVLDFSYDTAPRQLTVRYSITNPDDDSAYDLTEGLQACLADVNNGLASANDCRDLEGATFSRFSLTIGSLTVAGARPSIDDYSDHSASLFAWQGAANGDGSYTAVITLPAQAVGTARFLTSGQAQERRIIDLLNFRFAMQANTVIDAANAAANGVDWDWANRVRVPIANVLREFPVDASLLNERRQVVADENCNACHGRLGTASGSNQLANAFHRGERSSVAACPVCHTPNRASSTEMSDEQIQGGGIIEPLLPDSNIRMNQSFEFKNMIHAIHGGQKRVTPFLHNADDLSGSTHFPGRLGDCNTCHQNQSYLISNGKLGSAVSREDDLAQRRVISPYASSCMGCHDSAAARLHMGDAGGASVGGFTQAQWLSGVVNERCGECHGPGGAKDVAAVHSIRE